MSADPIVQAPYNLKSFNRYSYVWNNPLANFDPTGFFSWSVGGPNDTSTPTSYGYTPTSTSAQRGESYGCTGCGTSESNGSIGSSRNHVTGSNSNSEAQSWRPLSGGLTDCLNGGCGSVLAPPVNLGGKIGKAVNEYGWSVPQLAPWGVGGLWGFGQAVLDGDLPGALFSAATIPVDLWGAGAGGAVLRAEKLATKAAKAAAVEGKTVLGHFPEYKRLGDSLNARTFQIPESAWNKMSEAERWGANQKFLDRMISRGDEVLLATPLDRVRPGSYFARELEYMGSKGFTPSADGTRLLRP